MFLPKIHISIKAVLWGSFVENIVYSVACTQMAENSNGTTSLPAQTQKTDYMKTVCMKTDTEISSECTDEIGSGIKTLCQSL